MSVNEYNDPKNSLVLFELGDKLDFLIKLYNSKKLPRVLMLTGKKGIGKFTLINHFLNYIYDNENYDRINNSINSKTFTGGHIISEKNGGFITVDNILPICNSCNSSMGSTNMDIYIQKYYKENYNNFIKKYYNYNKKSWFGII